jgi:hypothetical protein
MIISRSLGLRLTTGRGVVQNLQGATTRHGPELAGRTMEHCTQIATRELKGR